MDKTENTNTYGLKLVWLYIHRYIEGVIRRKAISIGVADGIMPLSNSQVIHRLSPYLSLYIYIYTYRQRHSQYDHTHGAVYHTFMGMETFFFVSGTMASQQSANR